MVLGTIFVLMFHGCGGSNNKAMSLEFFDKIYVPVDAGSLLSLDEALKEKEIGQVTSDDLKLKYIYLDSAFSEATAPALVIYSDPSFIPRGTLYMAMRVRSFYEIAVKDDKAAGIVVNPDVPEAQSYTMTRREIQEAIPHLATREPLPKDIIIVP
jgi:hypothetical protein